MRCIGLGKKVNGEKEVEDNEMIKVSILVPICNVEKFLDKCLRSIVNQTLTDIEIICINDGSKDKSLEIIKNFAKDDERIVVIDKPNSGYGDSMNKGMSIAKGEYVGIVESDDFINLDMFNDLYSLAKEHNADIVKSNYNLYWEKQNDVFKYYNNLLIDKIVSDRDNAKEKILWRAPSIWSAIYKRSFLTANEIKFLSTPGASYQDTSFNFKTAALANRVVLTPEAYLNYRQDNSNSSVKIATKEKVMMLHKEYDEIKSFVEQMNLIELKPTYIVHRFRGNLWNYGRIKEDLTKEYFEIFSEEIVRQSESDKVYKNSMISVFGTWMYGAMKMKNKALFDILLKVYNRKEKTLRSLAKRNLYKNRKFKWL